MKILIVLLSSLTMLLLAGCVATERDIAQERVSESPIAVDVPEDVVEQESSRTSRDKMEELFETISCELERFVASLRDNDALARFAVSTSTTFIFAANEIDAREVDWRHIGIFDGKILSDSITLSRHVEENPEFIDIIKEICQRGVIREIQFSRNLRDRSVRVDFLINREHIDFLLPPMRADYQPFISFWYTDGVPSPGGLDVHIRDNWFWNRFHFHTSPNFVAEQMGNVIPRQTIDSTVIFVGILIIASIIFRILIKWCAFSGMEKSSKKQFIKEQSILRRFFMTYITKCNTTGRPRMVGAIWFLVCHYVHVIATFGLIAMFWREVFGRHIRWNENFIGSLLTYGDMRYLLTYLMLFTLPVSVVIGVFLCLRRKPKSVE